MPCDRRILRRETKEKKWTRDAKYKNDSPRLWNDVFRGRNVMRTLRVMLPSAVMCAWRVRAEHITFRRGEIHHCERSEQHPLAKPSITKASEFVFLILDRLAKASFYSLLSLKQGKQFVIDLIFIVKMQTKLTKAFGIMG